MTDSAAFSQVVFRLTVDAEPGMLPRVMMPFAKRDLVPERFAARRMGDALVVEIALTGAPETDLHLATGDLRRMVGLRSLAVERASVALAA